MKIQCLTEERGIIMEAKCLPDKLCGPTTPCAPDYGQDCRPDFGLGSKQCMPECGPME